MNEGKCPHKVQADFDIENIKQDIVHLQYHEQDLMILNTINCSFPKKIKMTVEIFIWMWCFFFFLGNTLD